MAAHRHEVSWLHSTVAYCKGRMADPSIYDICHDLGVLRALRRWFSGKGVIFLFHRVGDADRALAPMFVSPESLENAIIEVRRFGWEIVSLDEAYGRLLNDRPKTNPFVCFTFDDGYRDNYELALPIFRRHQAPFCVYIATGLIDNSINPWWSALETLVTNHSEIDLRLDDGSEMRLPAHDGAEKKASYWALWDLAFPDLSRMPAVFERLYDTYGITAAAEAKRIAMTWNEVRQLASDPLATIGAHTVSHPILTKLNEDQAIEEIARGRDRLEQELGRKIDHFAYPFGFLGSREIRITRTLGFKTAVTTREGNLFREHGDQPYCLPRRNVEQQNTTSRFIRNSLWGVDSLKSVMRRRHRMVTESLWRSES